MTDPKKYGDALIDLVASYGKRYGLVPIPEPKVSYDADAQRIAAEIPLPARTPTIESDALAFATHAHRDQKRKYTFRPYIEHPLAVAELVRSVPHTEKMIAAALLHDTVEDCGVSIAEIERHCGIVVACFVEQLTDVSKPSDGNRAARKAIDRAHSAKAAPESKTVKLADLIDNSRSILEHDREFARVYIEEKRLLLEVLREGDATLWARADAIVKTATHLLRQ